MATIDDGHEFRGGQVFESPTYRQYKLELCNGNDGGINWALWPIPGWSDTGGCLQHDAHGRFFWTSEELREKVRSWKYLGEFHKLYKVQELPKEDWQ